MTGVGANDFNAAAASTAAAKVAGSSQSGSPVTVTGIILNRGRR
jgi:hypothetical protein